jgi:Sulfotransferase family
MILTRGRPILVTGTHRSGSTWVGKMIASHPRVGYVDEPFNPELHPHCPVRHMWHHVTAEDEKAFAAYLRGHLRFDYSWWKDFRAYPSPRRVVGSTLRTLAALRHRYFSRPLLKDPIAFFSAEWLAATCRADVIILVRHPAAFASSLKRLQWAFPFHNLLGQPRLMRDHLEPFRGDIERVRRAPLDLIEHAVLVWRIIHHVALGYRERHPDWVFVRHEDLSLRPEEEYEKLFARLGLTFTRRVRRTIRKHTSSANEAEAPGRVPHLLHRDSRKNVSNWKHRLTPEEVARVYRGTQDVARFFYSDSEWDSPPR